MKIGNSSRRKTQAGFFRYRNIGDRYLLTNDSGSHVFLSTHEFEQFVSGDLDRKSLVYRCLDEENFVGSTFDAAKEVVRYRNKYSYVRQGTSLHIVIPTLRCNHRCVYCHARAAGETDTGYDMDEKTARKVVDAIFQTPNNHISIEFQGGEPLLNWDMVKCITQYALAKNKVHKKNLQLVLVSNLTALTEKKLDFLLKNKVSICTSLDGPKFIHDRQRPMSGGASGYDLTTAWMKVIRSRTGYLNALATFTSFSLKHIREVIHEYVRMGITTVTLRPVSVLGLAGERRETLGFQPEEFVAAYRDALAYLIELTEITGENITERMATVALQKIFNPCDPSFLDMRSPCGAGCGQLAYMYDGSVYTCDEARMLGNDAFKLGNVHTHSYADLMRSRNMQAAVFASCTDGLYCEYCAYKPYCGVCPVVNWQECSNLYSQPNKAMMCKVHKGIFDAVFGELADVRRGRILKKWI